MTPAIPAASQGTCIRKLHWEAESEFECRHSDKGGKKPVESTSATNSHQENIKFKDTKELRLKDDKNIYYVKEL